MSYELMQLKGKLKRKGYMVYNGNMYAIHFRTFCLWFLFL